MSIISFLKYLIGISFLLLAFIYHNTILMWCILCFLIFMFFIVLAKKHFFIKSGSVSENSNRDQKNYSNVDQFQQKIQTDNKMI